jgi:hypothetical protein
MQVCLEAVDILDCRADDISCGNLSSSQQATAERAYDFDVLIARPNHMEGASYDKHAYGAGSQA